MSITLPDSVAHQLQFLVAEIDRQLSTFHRFLEHPDKEEGEALTTRTGYSYNLERRIEHACTDILSMDMADIDTQTIRSVEKVANHLQDIAEHISKCTRDLIDYKAYNHTISIKALLADITSIRKQVKLIPKLLQRKNPDAILKSYEKHEQLADIYKRERDFQIRQLEQSAKPQPHIDTLFISYEIQRMAEHLTMAYEAMLSGILGQPVNVEQLMAIRKGIKKIDKDRELADINLETLALTKSGSTVSALLDNQKKPQQAKSIAVFKDGDKRKLREELDSLETWQFIQKGLTPQIFHFKKFHNRASLLVEHLEGDTFEHLLHHGDGATRRKANKRLIKTLKDIYKKTNNVDKKPLGFMRQLLDRFDAVGEIHPQFDKKKVRQKIQEAAAYEKKKLAYVPMVFIHGDFNIDNILYNKTENTVHFIDVRRSTYQDYVQDISVFLVSNYRQDYASPKVRDNIIEQINELADFARSYAHSIEDHSFEVRLALGLARSLLTSTRFILDKHRSELMFDVAMQLIDGVLQLNRKAWPHYSVDLNTVFHYP